MPNLSIKNVPDEVLIRLRERAQSHHRSLQGELLAILDEAIQPKSLTAAEVLRQVNEMGLRTDADSVTFIREDRDGR